MTEMSNSELALSKRWCAGIGLGDAYAGIHAGLCVYCPFSLVKFTLQKPKALCRSMHTPRFTNADLHTVQSLSC